MNSLEKRVERLENDAGVNGMAQLLERRDESDEQWTAKVERAREKVRPTGILFLITGTGAI